MKYGKGAACVLAATALLAAACGDDSKSSSSTTATTKAGSASSTASSTASSSASSSASTTAAGSTTSAAGGAGTLGGSKCDGSLKGKTVKAFSSIRDIEADRLAQAWKPFETCTGVKIDHEGSGEFEAQLKVRVQGGNAPDIAFIPQPGLMQSLAKDGKLVARDDLKAQVESDNGKDWVTYGSGLDGKFYAPPLGANLKSLVWYSPKQFKAKGYTVPKTYDEMIALSDKIVAAGGKPWCAGIESGGATGWPATDWMEEVMLKQFGPQDYDAWVNNTLKFNDPKVKQAADTVAKILLNDKYMKGGVKSVATTSFQDGGLGVLDGSCFMHKQANFYANQWPQGTNVGPDGDVSTFPFPAINSQYANAVEGGGEVIGEFRDAPEVRAVVNYLTSVDFAKSRAAIGSWLTSNKKLDTSVYTNAQEKLFADQLKNASIFRFDASDLMPAAVGAGTFWKEMTAWIGQGKDTQKVLDDIQASWPKS